MLPGPTMVLPLLLHGARPFCAYLVHGVKIGTAPDICVKSTAVGGSIRLTIRHLIGYTSNSFFFFFHTFTFQLLDKPWSQVPSLFPPGSCLQFFIAHRVQQSHFSSIFHRVLLTHAVALSASQFVHKKKSPRIYTSVHSGGFELTKLTYTRLEDDLISHWGDRLVHTYLVDFGAVIVVVVSH